MNFYEKMEYNYSDIQMLIVDEIEENLHLDYKDGRALCKDDKKRMEITKDISAFANSDGGIIVYGVTEANHKPVGIAPVDGSIYTKEWLEQVIQRISRRIKDVKIYPIRIDGDITKTIYVVKIPVSNDCPHMAEDRRYYKRFNFSSVPMEEYEVRASFNKKLSPTLTIEDCVFYQNNDEEEEYVEYNFKAYIYNDSNNVGDNYKLNAIFCEDFGKCSFSYNPQEERLSYTILHRFRMKVAMPSKEYIYPYETVEVGHFKIKVDRSYASTYMDNLVIELNLYYQGGSYSAMYIPKSDELITDETRMKSLTEQSTNRINKIISIEKEEKGKTDYFDK